jgi:hypothetical protein
LDSPLAPSSIPAWSAALQAVDRSLLLEAPKTFGHYAFPDPGLFVGLAGDEKKAKFVETWLRIREAWIVRVAHGSLAMSGQQWRDILSTDFSTLLGPSDTKAMNRRKRVHDILMPRSSSDAEVKVRITAGEPFFWQGCGYLPGALPSEDVIRQVLWELYELNFTHELLSLDRHACENLDLMDSEQLLERQSLIAKCFVVDTFQSIPLPNHNGGLAADTLRERLPYLRQMVHVMMAWKGSKPTVFYLADLPMQRLLDQQVEELESVVTRYYCQQLFTYFGRAAQVPHRLF